MLEIRPTCENCGKKLPSNSTDAMVCSYECTFCQTCVDEVLENVCPNCGGGFEKRPIRPTDCLTGNCVENDPPSEKVVSKPVDFEKFAKVKEHFLEVPPEKR